MKVIVAEKPSVARAIAAVVGAKKVCDGYLSGNGFAVSWCIGHLVEYAMPESYDPVYKKWDLSTLPILPSQFKSEVKRDRGIKKQFRVLKELMCDKDTEYIICAGDAAREGELIFRLVYDRMRCRKRVMRLWISSMEDSAIREGLAAMKDNHEYDSLADAAYCRAQADWLYGINLTRLYSLLYAPYKQTYNCGRVQTPTVALIVERQRAIDNFSPEPYFVVTATAEGVPFTARFSDQQNAIELERSCVGKPITITSAECKEKRKAPPLLYDLTTLQRDANRLLGYSAQTTLDLLQQLYEHKLATYPRTESRHITDDMEGPVRSLVADLLKASIVEAPGVLCDEIDVKRIVDNAKVSDHPAILPTREVNKTRLAALDEKQRNILLLVAYCLVESVAKPNIFTSTKLVGEVEGVSFAATGTTSIDKGWCAVEQKCRLAVGASQESERETEIPLLHEGENYPVVCSGLESKKTKPPRPYTEDTLLSAMETCGKEIDDEDARVAMKDSGLGTPATRAATIEGIIRTGYVKRSKKNLVPTDIAFDFIDVVDATVKSPELTGIWEKKLADVQNHRMSAEAFMQSIKCALAGIVTDAKNNPVEGAKKMEERKVIGMCPLCGADVIDAGKTYKCVTAKWDSATKTASGCPLTIWKTMSGREISEGEAQALLENGRIDSLEGFTSKRTGKSFGAPLKLEGGRAVFDFDN